MSLFTQYIYATEKKNSSAIKKILEQGKSLDK